MRVLTLLTGLCFAVAVAIATSGSALSEQNKPAGTAVAPAQGQAVAPTTSAKPAGAVGPGKATGGTTVAPLTDQECTDLGGTVKNEGGAASACLSGKACQTVGEDKNYHAVCISKQ
jgi:hypothetical protein